MNNFLPSFRRRPESRMFGTVFIIVRPFIVALCFLNSVFPAFDPSDPQDKTPWDKKD